MLFLWHFKTSEEEIRVVTKRFIESGKEKGKERKERIPIFSTVSGFKPMSFN